MARADREREREQRRDKLGTWAKKEMIRGGAADGGKEEKKKRQGRVTGAFNAEREVRPRTFYTKKDQTRRERADNGGQWADE